MGKALELSEMTPDEIKARVKKLPGWAQEYIEDLRGRAEELETIQEDVQRAEDFDEALAANWTHVAFMRVQAGDEAGATRAFFAAGVFRS